jgi:hypothetical protein
MRHIPPVVGSLGIATLVIGVFSASEARAQIGVAREEAAVSADSDEEKVRVGLGLGAGSLGLAGRVGVTIDKSERRFFTLRAATVEEFTLFGPAPVERVWDVAVLYGAQTRSRRAYASAAAGIALVGGMRRGERLPGESYDCSIPPFCLVLGMMTRREHEELPFHTIGLPVELEAGFALTSRFGINASAWANLNPERNMAGLSLGLILGKLR